MTHDESGPVTGSADQDRDWEEADRARGIEEERLIARVKSDFTYHSPKPGQPELYESLRASALDLAVQLIEMVPPGRELSSALTHLETAVMHANAGIARHG